MVLRGSSSTHPSTGDFVMSVAVCFAAGGLYGWSGLIPALQATFFVSTESAGLVFSLAIVAFSAAVYAAPRLPDRLRGPTGAAVAGMAGVAALIVAAWAPSFAVFLVAYSLGFGAASGAVYILALEVAGRTGKANLSTAIMVASFGLGGAAFGPAFRFLVAADWGMNALLVLAAVLAGTSLVALLVTRPLADDVHESGPMPQPKRPATGHGDILLLWTAFATGSVAGLMILGLATAMIESRGGGVGLSGFALACIAIANTAGRLSVGVLAGAIPVGLIAAAASLMSSAALAGAGFATSPEMVAISLAAVAAGYGMVASSFPNLTRSLSGPAAFGRTYAVVFTAWGLAGLLSPWLGGRLFDATSSFDAALAFAFGASALSVVLSWIIHLRQSRPGSVD